MIISFKSDATRLVWQGEFAKNLPHQIQPVARRKLRMIHAASRIEDLLVPPGNQLDALAGDRKGQYSIRINRQWRICFKWINDNAEDVEICDYH